MHRKLAACLLAACLPWPAQATNWLQLQGNEPPLGPKFKLFGFVQPTYTYIDADPISGLVGANAAFNGRLTVPNRIGPDLDSNRDLEFLRARLGARGSLTDKINYFVLTEAGRNAVTAQHEFMFTDASLSFNFIPGARIRAGLFKVPAGEEALVAVHTSYPYVYFSNASQNLQVENQVRFDGGAFNAAGVSTATTVSGGSGFRDWGMQVYDWFDKGSWEFSYAAMLSNGDEVENVVDSDGDKDLTLRFQTSYIFDKSKGPNREDVSVYVWRQSGERRFNGRDFDRDRQGVGFKFLKGAWRVSGEYLAGDGMIVAGPNPPFPGQATQVGVNEKADGWYLEGGWRFHPRWEIDLRHDDYDRMTENAALEREFGTDTLGLQYFIDKNTRVTLNYEWRDLKVANPAAIPAGGQRNNAVAIADNLGDRISLQLTWHF
jgi:hypothetical protein